MIRFQVLGGLELGRPDGPQLGSILRQPRRLALFTYLALEGSTRCVHRDRLLGMFWPEREDGRARGALNQSLYVLRRSLGDAVLRRDGADGVVLGKELWCDAIAFQEAICAGRLGEALALYRGDLLGGMLLADVPEFEQWLEQKRTTLRRMAADAAANLAAEVERAGRGADAVPLLRRAAALTPLEEGTVRKLVSLLGRRGERVAAVQTYQEFERRLNADLGLTPSTRIRAVVEAIRSGSAA